MADLNQVRIQVLDPETGTVVDNVDVKTSDGAVYLKDGSTLRSWLEQHQDAFSKVQRDLAAHLAKTHVDPAKVKDLFTDMTYDGKTGVFTITKHDGTTKTVDTLLEKVTVNFSLEDGAYDKVADTTGKNPATEGWFEKSGNDYIATSDTTPTAGKDYYVNNTGKTFLVLTAEDGTKQYLDVSKLLNIYTGSTGSEITVTVGADNKIGASVNAGSIAEEKLTSAVQTKLNQKATTTDLGRVIVGNGIAVDANGKISTSNVQSNGTAASVNFAPVTNTVELSVSGPEDAVVFTTVGTAVSPLVVIATKSGTGAANATLAYQWYKKVIGTDTAFSAIDGATTATLAAADIAVAATGSTIYYCVVSASGEGVVADPVTSSRTTVVVNAAA